MSFTQKLVNKFVEHPGYLGKGAGYLAKEWKTTKEEIYKAREMARSIMASGEISLLNEVILEQEEQLAKYIGSETTSEGSIQKFESTRPLTPKEIEELAGVDNINTTIGQVWNKLSLSGKWTYSISVKFKIKDFYSSEELKSKLVELFPTSQPKFEIPSIPKPSSQILNIMISDDHVGMINETSLYGSEPYSEELYSSRLDELYMRILKLNTTFEEINIISLGDQMNGYNKLTTRGGHEVNSKSNKEQFDSYVKARKSFYDSLFQSKLAESFSIWEINNSNHSGLGFSYMANRALEIYLEAKYPEVTFHNTTDSIVGFEYGKNIILLTHGKDEKFQKRPMPIFLNDKTDLTIYDWLSHHGYNPKDYAVTLYKGDLHSYGIQDGKFGRYINIPSIAGASDYSDNNFGMSRAGALLEILTIDGEETTIPIWFKK